MDLFSEEEIMQRANAQRQLMLDNEENYDQLATAEKIAYGAAQETTLTGNLFRYGEALYDSITDDVSYDTALSRVEDERQRDIFKEYPKFKGISEAKEGAAELTGRLGVAVADPVTWLFPWLKVAKAGKLAGAAAGAGFNATDAALRDQLVYGEINPINVGAATVLGGAAGALSGHLAAKYRRGQPIDSRVAEAVKEVSSSPSPEARISVEAPTADKLERLRVKPSQAGEKPRVIVPALTSSETEAIEEAAERVVTAQSRLANVPEATGTGANLTMRYEPIRKMETILSDLKALQGEGKAAAGLKKYEARKKRIIKKAEKQGKDIPSLEDINERIAFFRTAVIQKPKGKDIKNQITELKSKIEKAKDNFYSGHIQGSVNRVDLAGNTIEDLNENGKLTDNILKSLIFEPTRPIIGGIGGYVTSGIVGDEDDDHITAGLVVAGAALGQWQKVLQNMKLTGMDLEKAKMVLTQSAEQNLNTTLKFHTAGTVATKSDALGGWNKVLANLIFQKPGGATNAIETLNLSDNASFRAKVVGIYGDSFENQKVVKTVTEAMRGWRDVDSLEEGYTGISGLFKNNALTAEDVEEVKRIVPLMTKANNEIKDSMRKAGIEFDELQNYGLSQAWDFNFIQKAGEDSFFEDAKKAFKIQYENKQAAGLIKNIPDDEGLDNIVGTFVDNIRGINRVTGAKNKYNSYDIFDSNGRFRPLAKNFEKHRALTDTEATAFMAEKGWLNLDSTAVSMQYADRAIKMRNWANTLGANGELFNRALDDVERAFKNKRGSVANFKDTYKKNLTNMAEVYWGVHGAGSASGSLGNMAMATLTTLANSTMLTRVSISALGDLIQPIQNSGVMPAVRAAMSKVTPGESFSSKSGFKYDKSFEREYSALMAHASTDPFSSFQSALDSWNKNFFKIVQLERITKVARGFAYDVGVRRAYDIAKKVESKGGKVSASLQKEMNQLGIQSVDDLQIVAKYSNINEAFDAEDGQKILNMAGRRSADRDAIVPLAGNRLYFSQTNNPYIKSLGQFLSWAQAKTAQTNALVERIENKDAALAVRALGLSTVYMAVQAGREWASPYQVRQSEAHDTFSTEHLKESLKLSGNILPWHIDKIVSGLNAPDNKIVSANIAPSLGYADTFMSELFKFSGNLEAGDVEGAGRNVLNVVPFGKEVTGYSRRITGSPLLEDRPNYDKGGEVLDVPNAPSEPDQRIDKMTGMPYNQQAGTAFTDVEDREDPLQRMGFAFGSVVTRAGAKLFKAFDDDLVDETPLKTTDEILEDNNIFKGTLSVKHASSEKSLKEFIDPSEVNPAARYPENEFGDNALYFGEKNSPFTSAEGMYGYEASPYLYDVDSIFDKAFVLTPQNIKKLASLIPEDKRRFGGDVVDVLKSEGYDGLIIRGFDDSIKTQKIIDKAERKDKFYYGIFQDQVISFDPKKNKILNAPEVRQGIVGRDAEIADSMTEKDIAAWQEANRLPESKRQKQRPEIVEKLESVLRGDASYDDYVSEVDELFPPTLYTKENAPEFPTLVEVRGAVGKKTLTGGRGIVGADVKIEEGRRVSSRLDIPAYDLRGVWAVTLHNPGRGSAFAYGQTSVLKNVDFTTDPKFALNIALGQSKGTIARMEGDWVNHNPRSIYNKAIDLLESNEWVQVGMNPFKHSYFYDKKTMLPVVSAEEVIQVGPLVLVKKKGMKTASPNDPMFKVNLEELKNKKSKAPLAIMAQEGKVNIPSVPFNKGGKVLNSLRSKLNNV